MTTLVSDAYLDKLRNGHPHRNAYHLSVIVPDVVWCGTVTGSPAFGDEIIYTTTVSGSFANAKIGYTVYVGTAPGDYSISKRRLKNTGVSNIVVDENTVNWTVGYYVTIVAMYDFWNIYPYNLPDPPYTFYKDHYDTYTDENKYPRPVAIAGPYKVGFLDGASISFTLDARSSYTIASGATISSYLWECDDGVIASASSSLTTITFIAPGKYWVDLTVTDSNSKTHKTHRLYVVHDRAANAPYYNFRVSAPLTQDIQTGGWKTTIEIRGDATLATYPEGSLVFLWSTQYFQSTEYYLFDNIKLIGYFRRTADQTTYDTGVVTFDIETVHSVMMNSGMYNVSLEWSDKADTWYRYYKLTSARAMHHYLKYHSNLLDITDVYLPVEDTTEIPACDDFEKGDLHSQVEGFAYNHSIFAHLMCDKHNRVYISKDIHLQGTTQRDAADTMWWLTSADHQPEVEIAYNIEPKIGHIIVSGGVRNPTDGLLTPIISQAPGEVPSNRGAQENTLERLVIPTQAAGNVLAGRVYAVANRRIDEVRITLAGAYHNVLEIYPQRWLYAYALPNSKGEDLSGRYTLQYIETTVDVEKGTETTIIAMVPDVDSVDGIPGPYPPDPEGGDGGDPEGGNSNPPEPPPPPPPVPNTQFADIMVAVDEDIRSSEDMYAGTVSWTSKYSGITGTIVDACHMRGAPKGVVFALTETMLYRTTDFLSDNPAWEEYLDIAEYTNADAGIPDGFQNPIASRVLAGAGYLYVVVNDGVTETDITAYLIGEDIMGTYCSEIGTIEDAITSYTVKSADFSYSHVWNFTIAPFDAPLERMTDDDNLQSPWALAFRWEGSYYPGPGNTWEATVSGANNDANTYNSASFGINPYTTGGDPWVPLVPVATVNSLLSVADRLAARAMLDDYFGTWQQAIGYPHEMPKEAGRTKFLLQPNGLGWGYPSTGTGTVTGTVYAFYNIPVYNTVKAIDCGKHDPKIVYVSLIDSGKIVRSIDGGRTWEDYITDHAAYDIECHSVQSSEDGNITFISDEGRLYRTNGNSIGSSLYLELSPTNQPYRVASDPVDGYPIYMLANSGTGYLVVKRGESSTTFVDGGYDPSEALGICIRVGATAATRRIYYLGDDDIRYSEDGETFESKKGDWSGYANPVNISPLYE